MDRGWSGEAVAGALYLFCGAVFPLDALVGRVAHQHPSLVGISDAELLALLVVMTLALGAVAAAMFRRCDFIARERGLIDRTTNY